MSQVVTNLEALWTVEFITEEGVIGAGVVIGETGRIFGGDSAYDDLRLTLDHVIPGMTMKPTVRFTC